MNEINKILIPVDFSANSVKLLEFAAVFADKFGASLSLLNVIENPAAYDGFTSAGFDEELREAMEKKMANLVEDNKGLCGDCDTKVVIGDTVDTILSAAENSDLVIIGTHGYKGLEKILMGSVAERVVKNSPCPVLVFNPYK